MQGLTRGGDDWTSAAIPSNGNPYGVPDGLVYSFPLHITGPGTYEMITGLELSAYAIDRLRITTEELQEERDAILELLK